MSSSSTMTRYIIETTIIIKKSLGSRTYTQIQYCQVYTLLMQSYVPILGLRQTFHVDKKKSAIGPMTTGAQATKDRISSIISDTKVCYRRSRWSTTIIIIIYAIGSYKKKKTSIANLSIFQIFNPYPPCPR